MQMRLDYADELGGGKKKGRTDHTDDVGHSTVSTCRRCIFTFVVGLGTELFFLSLFLSLFLSFFLSFVRSFVRSFVFAEFSTGVPFLPRRNVFLFVSLFVWFFFFLFGFFFFFLFFFFFFFLLSVRRR